MPGNAFTWLKTETPSGPSPSWRRKEEPTTSTSSPSGTSLSWRRKPESPTSTFPPSGPSPSSRSSWRKGSASSGSSSFSSAGSSSPNSCSPSPPSPCSSSPPGRAWRDTNWRTPQAPRTPSPAHNAKPAFEDLRLGQVMYLPHQEEVPNSSVFHKRMALRDDSPWGHPVVILKKKTESTEEMVEFRLVTSFRDGETFARKSEESKESIALCQNTDNVEAHRGLNGVYTRLLTLEPGSDQFNKPSYVSFFDKYNDDPFCIEYCHIQPWIIGTGRAKNIVFDQESLARIKNKQVR
ncbi:hypothetical protein P171DRAFT_498266 [Karstenula rhodostoma CBS 690.94]|uniref:Uncharacterized protein n=1 Tax=Karstenula rhodostoma CBS 690.94 TaxID=1392251 RepID=A0A9P4PF36_9PLEO|nr:hypothetical protein P171DRAFT_498266 [Karstenula rhodostoma CBS 690.94]